MASSPGSRAHAHAQDALDRLHAANAHWHDAYSTLKHDAQAREFALERRLADSQSALGTMSADLSTLNASLSSLLSELSFPELSLLEKHLAANPMPPGGLPALQRQAADALAVVRLQDAVREERNQWWKVKDQVENELEDERERRSTLELEVQKLRRASSKSKHASPDATRSKTSSSTRTALLTPSKSANLPSTMSPAPSPPVSPSTLKTRNRQLAEALRKLKDKHKREKRQWREFGEGLIPLYREMTTSRAGGSKAVMEGQGASELGSTPGMAFRSTDPTDEDEGLGGKRERREIRLPRSTLKDVLLPSPQPASTTPTNSPARPKTRSHLPSTADRLSAPSSSHAISSSPVRSAPNPLPIARLGATPLQAEEEEDDDVVATSVSYERLGKTKEKKESAEEKGALGEKPGSSTTLLLPAQPSSHPAHPHLAESTRNLEGKEEDVFRAAGTDCVPPSKPSAEAAVPRHLPPISSRRPRSPQNLEAVPAPPLQALVNLGTSKMNLNLEGQWTPFGRGDKSRSGLPTPDTSTRPAAPPSRPSLVSTPGLKPAGAASGRTGNKWLGRHMFVERVREGGTSGAVVTPASLARTARRTEREAGESGAEETPVSEGGVRPLDFGTRAGGGGKGKERAREADGEKTVDDRSPLFPTSAFDVKPELRSEDVEILALPPDPNLPLAVDRSSSPPPALRPIRPPWDPTLSQEEAERLRFRQQEDPMKGLTEEERRGFKRRLMEMSGRERLAIFGKFKGRGRYAGDLEANTTVNQEFEIIPERNQGRDYAFDEVVRGRDARKQLHGADCPCCRGYYEALGDLRPLPAGPAWKAPQPSPVREGETPNERLKRKRVAAVDQHRQDVSRHRDEFERPATPPDYWEIGMYDDDQIQEINRQAREIQDGKRRKLAEEAGKENGKYRRRS